MFISSLCSLSNTLLFSFPCVFSVCLSVFLCFCVLLCHCFCLLFMNLADWIKTNERTNEWITVSTLWSVECHGWFTTKITCPEPSSLIHYMLRPRHTLSHIPTTSQKSGGRSKNLYIVEGTQCNPIRSWCGLHKRWGRGRILNMFKKELNTSLTKYKRGHGLLLFLRLSCYGHKVRSISHQPISLNYVGCASE